MNVTELRPLHHGMLSFFPLWPCDPQKDPEHILYLYSLLSRIQWRIDQKRRKGFSIGE